MTCIRLALMLYFYMIAHKAACQTLSKAFSKSMKIWMSSCCCFSWDFLQFHLPCIFQILQVRIFYFSVLSFYRKDQEIRQWPGFFFLLTMFAKDLTGCFSHCCVEGGDHWIYVCIFVAHDSERCKPSAYHSLEGFQQFGIFQLFKVKLESCVFWLADFFFPRRRRKVISSSTSSTDRKCFLTRM